MLILPRLGGYRSPQAKAIRFVSAGPVHQNHESHRLPRSASLFVSGRAQIPARADCRKTCGCGFAHVRDPERGQGRGGLEGLETILTRSDPRNHRAATGANVQRSKSQACCPFCCCAEKPQGTAYAERRASRALIHPQHPAAPLRRGDQARSFIPVPPAAVAGTSNDRLFCENISARACAPRSFCACRKCEQCQGWRAEAG